jgi:GT2 family glycosyltransferase
MGAREARARRPTVSVIVPCYNYGRLLAGCLTSVLSQENVDVSVLVIDDLSTDDSAEVCRRLAEADDRVELRVHAKNMGLIATANEGLEWASGEYVVLLSADDQLVSGSLSRATEIMGKHPNVGMVYGQPLLAYEGRALPQSTGTWRATKIWPGREWIRLRCRSGHSCISSPEVVVRNSVQRTVGRYDAVCHHTSDLNMWLRIAAASDIAHVRGVPQAIYRIHAGSMLRSQEGPMVDLRERRAAFERFFASHSSSSRGPERGRAVVARTLARQALWQASRAVDRGLNPELVGDLSAFALEVYPDTRRLKEWRGLMLRQRIGAGRSLLFFPFIATALAHRLRHRAEQMRWRYTGI